jgi:hypothetical protein
MEATRNDHPEPGAHLAAMLTRFFAEWPCGDDGDSAHAAIAITDRGGLTHALVIRAEEANALAELVRRECISYRNSHPDINGPCGHCGGNGKPPLAAATPAGGRQQPALAAGPKLPRPITVGFSQVDGPGDPLFQVTVTGMTLSQTTSTLELCTELEINTQGTCDGDIAALRPGRSIALDDIGSRVRRSNDDYWLLLEDVPANALARLIDLLRELAPIIAEP